MLKPFEPLERRHLCAATLYDITVHGRDMTIAATGPSAGVSLATTYDDPGDETGRLRADGVELSLSGRFTVNGKKRFGTTLRFYDLSHFASLRYFGTPGTDDVTFDLVDGGFYGNIDVSLGGGNDRTLVRPGTRNVGHVGVNGGNGDDRVILAGNATTDFDVQGGSGRDKVYVSTAARQFHLLDPFGPTYLSIRQTVFAGGVSVITGRSQDSILIDQSTFTHHTVISTGAGLDTLTRTDSTVPRGAVIDLGDDQ